MTCGNLVFSFIVVSLLTSCAAPSANLPSTTYQDKDSIRRAHVEYGINYAKQRDKRIQGTFYQLIKNTGPELCDRKLRPGLGFDYIVRRPRLSWWQFQSAEEKQEEKDLNELHPVAEDNTIFVRYVIPGSAAEKAGLKEHDEIISIFGISTPGGTGVAAKFKKILDENLTNNLLEMPVEIEVSRRGKIIKLTVIPDSICPYELVIDKSSHQINAFSDGEKVYLTEEIIDYLPQDNDLAAVLSHELAHNTLGHIDSQQFNAALGMMAGAVIDIMAETDGSASVAGMEIGSNAYSKDFENEADYVSAYYMARAGFDYKEMRNLEKKLAARNMASIYVDGISHPKPQERFALLTETASEIDMKKNFKEELLPDFRSRNSHLEDKRD